MTNAQLPHSWNLKGWPPEVYPHTSKKGRYLARAYGDDLARAGALVRVGRELVFLGAPYSKWLQKQAGRVAGYTCAANKRDAAA